MKISEGAVTYIEAARTLEHIADHRILLQEEKALCRALARHFRKLEAENQISAVHEERQNDVSR